MRPENFHLERHENLLSGKVALITGSSRDIGAGIAMALAKEGVHIIGNYREKSRRANNVQQEILTLGVKANFVQADITLESDRAKLATALSSFGGKLDWLILNASGPTREINVDATNALVDLFLPKMPIGGKIVLMQSIPGHFQPGLEDKIPDFYQPIAKAKYEGEQSLRQRIKEFNEKGISFIVTCPPEVSGTSNMTVFTRRDPSISEKLEQLSANLELPATITIDEIGQRIVELLKRQDFPQGYIEFFKTEDNT